jgi:class 3 adenylate cyclase
MTPHRRDLPSGTVTFLFADVERSTELLHDLGEHDYAQALADHRRYLRQAFERHGGAEVDTQGDAFFVAFATAPGALAAAREATEALASGPVRVRIGVHTGTPIATDEGYVGMDVHRAARIAAAGHGGQVLVSGSTATLVDADLRDLGEHRLKDLRAAERIYQLGEGEFPPLKSLYRTNLPVPSTPFMGRARELSEVVGLLMREDVRLRLDDAVRIGAAADRIAEEMTLWSSSDSDVDPRAFGIPNDLGQARRDELVAEGRSLSEEEAIDLALSV